MEAQEIAGKYFLELYDKIPLDYRKRYGIRLVVGNEWTKFPTLFLEIKEARITIIPTGKEISVEEEEGRALYIKINGSGTIVMYRNSTFILTIL